MFDVSLLGDQILCVRLHVVRNESRSDDLCLDGRSEEENDRQAALSESERKFIYLRQKGIHYLGRFGQHVCFINTTKNAANEILALYSTS